MGRAKKKRRDKKIKKGLNIPFELYNRPLRSLENRYFYKANVYNCSSGKRQVFENVRFKNSNITKCNFKNTTFKGVDFIFSNLKKSVFKNCFFEDVIFFGSNMKESNFINSKFKNVYFINIDMAKLSGIENSSHGLFRINEYPELNLNLELEESLNNLALNNRIFKYRVVHTKQNKPSYWILSILLKDFSQSDLTKGFKRLSENVKKNSNKTFFTYYSFKDFFNKYLKNNGIDRYNIIVPPRNCETDEILIEEEGTIE